MAPMTQSSDPRRRELLKTAAWATPSMMLATAAPAFAASTDRCVPEDDGRSMTLGGHAWTMVSGALKTDENETGWLDADEFRSWDNNASTSEPAVFDAVTTFDAAAGATYEISLEVTVGAGTSPVGRNTQQVQIDVLAGAGEHKIVWVNATQEWAEELEGFTNQYTWDTAAVPYSATFTATEAGQATLRCRFTLPETPDVNDDIWVRRLRVIQIGCTP